MYSLTQNKITSLSELLDAINKGIELLANPHLDDNLYKTYVNYVTSTIKLIDMSFGTIYGIKLNPFDDYSTDITSDRYVNMSNPIINNFPHIPNSALNVISQNNYTVKLKDLLQKLNSIIKELINEDIV